MKHIVLNRIKTPDETILISRHRHDYVTYTDANGETYMIDGGTDYLRRSVNSEPFEEQSLYADAPHNEIRQGSIGEQEAKMVISLSNLNL